MTITTRVAVDAFEVQLTGPTLDLGTAVTLRIQAPGGPPIDVPAIVSSVSERIDRAGREVRSTWVRATVQVQVVHP
jgi:hypothetical protein